MKKINKPWRALFLVSFILVCRLTCGQMPDRVTPAQAFIDTITLHYSEENSFKLDPYLLNPTVNVPVRVNIIMNIKGSAGVTVQDIKYSLDVANSFFKNAGIKFFIDTLQYIKDYNYSYIKYNHLKKELLTKYAVARRINLFLADSIKLGSWRGYGFTYFPNMPDSNIIYLDKTYARGNYLTTMLGHFMGLLSTHETAGGRELASEKNCSSGGDFICDTYADPDLFNEVVDTCKYIGTMRDDNGKYFIPSVANIMSNSPDQCKCIMTPLQYRRIYYYCHRYRMYLKAH